MITVTASMLFFLVEHLAEVFVLRRLVLALEPFGRRAPSPRRRARRCSRVHRAEHARSRGRRRRRRRCSSSRWATGSRGTSATERCRTRRAGRAGQERAEEEVPSGEPPLKNSAVIRPACGASTDSGGPSNADLPGSRSEREPDLRLHVRGAWYAFATPKPAFLGSDRDAIMLPFASYGRFVAVRGRSGSTGSSSCCGP